MRATGEAFSWRPGTCGAESGRERGRGWGRWLPRNGHGEGFEMSGWARGLAGWDCLRQPVLQFVITCRRSDVPRKIRPTPRPGGLSLHGFPHTVGFTSPPPSGTRPRPGRTCTTRRITPVWGPRAPAVPVCAHGGATRKSAGCSHSLWPSLCGVRVGGTVGWSVHRVQCGQYRPLIQNRGFLSSVGRVPQGAALEMPPAFAVLWSSSSSSN